LTKKDDELRQLFLMQQSGNGDNPSDDISTGHNSDPSQLEDDEIGSDEVIRNISFKRLTTTTTTTTTTSTRINNNNNGNGNDDRSNSASPLNLSVDADDSQPDSSFGTFDSKVNHFLNFY
jgi:hypothetical protein